MPEPTASTAVRRRLPSSTAALAQLRSVARSYAAAQCGVDEDQSQLIALAVSEAATNVVRHAYPGRRGMIDFEAESDGNELRIRIADAGVGMAAESPDRGLGAGLRIMRGLAQTRVASRPGAGTEVELVFPLRSATPRPAFAEPPPHPRRLQE
ncbi:MAG TPA: ATP-binding protein [Gaiellales bacterium]|jgi:serine/threonine-protein kinase RsbW